MAVTYTNSSLAQVKILSPNYSSRTEAQFGNTSGKIDKITIHHMACNGTIEAIGRSFANPARGGSSNYGIGSDGRIALYVEGYGVEKAEVFHLFHKAGGIVAEAVLIADKLHKGVVGRHFKGLPYFDFSAWEPLGTKVLQVLVSNFIIVTFLTIVKYKTTLYANPINTINKEAYGSD